MVSVVDGTRKLFSGKDLQILLIDGNGNIARRENPKKSAILFTDIPLADNLRDNFRVLASANGYRDAGIHPVRLQKGVTRLVNLMLLPSSNEINFGRARWKDVKKRPELARVLGAGATRDAAERRYGDLEDFQKGEVLACLLNLMTAMEQAQLSQGTALSWMHSLDWDTTGPRPSLQRDRIFGWARVALRDQLDSAEGVFVTAPAGLHPGATCSFKQVNFGEANLQITLHENDRQTLSGVDCIRVELDIDYFHDAASHLLLEVAVNAFGNVTDPRVVYALRWMAGQKAGITEFDPLYTIVQAA